MDRMQVIYTASRNLYPYIFASLTSLLDYNPNAKVWMFVEDDELEYELPRNVELVNVSGQKFFRPDKCVNWRTAFTVFGLMRVTYAKLFTGEPNEYGIRTLPKLDRIIQLDVDTIVQDTLQPIWEVDLDGKWGAAVPDIPSSMRPWGKGNKYFNAGVMVFNLKQIRADGADDLAIEMVNNRKMEWIDEMAWNKLNNNNYNRKFADLDYRYNQTSAVQQTLEPAVVHYAGYKQWWQDFEKLPRPYYMMKYAHCFQDGKDYSGLEGKMLNYILKVSPDGMVKYYMENGKYPVTAETTFENAKWMLEQGKARVSDKHKGFPLTSDDVYFFQGEAEEVELTKSSSNRKRSEKK